MAVQTLPTSAPPESAARPRRQPPHGMILILVVLTLAIMAMLGMAYMQIARVDRESMTGTNNVDQVVDSAVAQIESVLTTDWNAQISASGTSYHYANYPWNASSVPSLSLSAGTGDSLALSSSSPLFINPADGTLLPNPVWTHVSVFGDRYLSNWNAANGTFNSSSPNEVLIANGATPKDTNIPILNAAGDTRWKDMINAAGMVLDNTGAGVPDSFWFWAPIRRLGNVSYIMAVKIIDNNAMVNLQTASGNLIDASGNYINNAAQWRSPKELDLGYLTFNIYDSPPPSFGQTAFNNELTPRFLPTQTMTPSPFGLADEFHLRGTRFGFNDLSTITAAVSGLAATHGMPVFWRENRVASNGPLSIPEMSLSDVFANGVTGPAANPLQRFFENEPRHQMTFYSGAVPLAPAAAGFCRSRHPSRQDSPQ